MTKLKTSAAVAFGIVIGMTSAHAAYSEHYGKLISTLYSAGTSPCVFFQLSGVTEANPVVPNGVWFAIDKTDKESYALLLSARISGTPLVRVLADGSTTCGVARAHVIEL